MFKESGVVHAWERESLWGGGGARGGEGQDGAAGLMIRT